jgi:PTH1 family peptidyl-tRNA hydrolase
MPSKQIKLIIGLGNPGPDYEQTRHNAGFWFVDQLAQQYGGTLKSESRFHGQLCRITAEGHDIRLLKPTTFMNRSGQAVAALANYFKVTPEEILVAHDELDIPCGSCRLKKGGGHGGHNGLRDIISALGTRDFYRLRIGIDHPGDAKKVVNYVLNRPSKSDMDAIEESLIDANRSISDILSGEFQKAMNQLHCSR